MRDEVKQCHSWVLGLFEKTAGQYFVISKFFPSRWQGQKDKSKDAVFTTHGLLPLCIFLLSFPEGLNFLSDSQSKKCQGEWAGLGVLAYFVRMTRSTCHSGVDSSQGAGWESLAWFKWSRGIWLNFARQKKGMHFPASGYANHWGGGGRCRLAASHFVSAWKWNSKHSL